LKQIYISQQFISHMIKQLIQDDFAKE